ncbi:MAG: Rrf2 family transcriptional regulator [bacterium]|nr:Rrf2 family transcriptional regulator [bacterium]
MINMSKTIKYGLRGLRYLARNREKGFIKIDEIAREEKLPENYLRKIFQQLIKNRVVVSGVGPKGGVKLPPGSDEISLAGVIEIIDGQPSFDECTLFGYTSCAKIENCPLQQDCNMFKENLWNKLRDFKLSGL